MNKKEKILLAISLCGIVVVSVFLSGCVGNGDNGNGNISPTVNAGINQSVNAGDTVSFTGIASDSDGNITYYEWDFDGNGVYDWSSTTTGSTTHVYNSAGTYTAKFRVTDDDGATATNTCTVTVTVIQSWHMVTTFTGVGNKDTDSFTIQGAKWRITWTTVEANEYALFGGFAYPEGETAMYVSYFNGLSGDTIVHQGNGNYYLKIIVANLDSWSVTIEDYY